ncbi:hypothetical protein [Streptomyces sp. NPDC002082]|uniref:hypothetical protein n=1 Tax=Streptomyces sp. NPDC002082 TaxID=3154772 RepID=UPI003334414F
MANDEIDVPRERSAMVGGWLGPGDTHAYFDSDGRGHFRIEHLDDRYTFHVDAELDEGGMANLFQVVVSGKGGKKAHVSSLRALPYEEILRYVNASLVGRFADRPSAAVMHGRLEQLPAQGRRTSPDRFLVTAWLVREAELKGDSANERVRNFFGYGHSSKANVSRLIKEARERYLPADPVTTHGGGRTAPEPVSTQEEIENTILRKKLRGFTERGGEAGALAAALQDEIDASASEPSSTFEIDEDELRFHYGVTSPDDPAGSPMSLRLRGALIYAYQQAFNELAISFRNARTVETVAALREASAQFEFRFDDDQLATQAAAIRDRQSLHYCFDPSRHESDQV